MRAKAICNVCPVQEPCAEYALAISEPYGIWGGTSEQDRKALVAS
jgi:WhiB family redox-sensing transcriptional regulator